MHAMMTGQPAPPILDPTSIAVGLVYKIYMAMKSRVLLGDKRPESVASALWDARDRTAKEVVHVTIRNAAVAKYDRMLALLSEGGQLEI